MRKDRNRLTQFFNPKSIAVVGGKESGRVLEQCVKLNYQGVLWAVNPHRMNLAGTPCVKDILDLPGVPDAVFLGISAEPTIEAVGILEHQGVGGVVCLASGFKEVGEQGEDRQNRLIQAAGSMPVLGPNCYGYINALTGAALFPDQHGLHRIEQGVAIIAASGNLGINLTLQQRSLPIAWLVTVGNQAILGIEDGLDAALACNAITAIGLHIEGLADVPRFIRLAEQAQRQGVPIIVLKAGKSQVGSCIAKSHTAVLSGETRLYTALFDRLGVGLVNTPEEFLEALKLAHVHGPLKGNRLVSMSCSGGEASLIADLAANFDLHFPEFDDQHAKLVRETLNEYVALTNPLDYHTFIWGDFDRTYRLFSAMMMKDVDLFVLIIDFPNPEICDHSEWVITMQAFVRACLKHQVKGAVVSCLTENTTPQISRYLLDSHVAQLNGMSQALAAINALSRVGMMWEQSPTLPKLSYFEPELDVQHIRSMDEYACKKLLKSWHIPIPNGERAGTLEEAFDALNRIRFPVAVKALDCELVHKSDAGAVMINISESQQLQTHIQSMLETWPSVLIEEMVSDTLVELIVGISYDVQFGHYLMIGAGGALVEMVKDTRLLMLPVDKQQIHDGLRSLKIWPLLNGYRGARKADLEALIDAIKNIAGLVEEYGQDIYELEINPLMVGASGVVAADALIRINNRQWEKWSCRNQ